MALDRTLIFGATGDMVSRLAFPGLGELLASRRLEPSFRIVAVARTPLSTPDYRDFLRPRLAEFAPQLDDTAREDLINRIDYAAADSTDAQTLGQAIAQVTDEGSRPVAVYLALPQALFADTIRTIGAIGLPPGSRIVVEKPFGESLAGAQALNALLAQVMEPDDAAYRVDHVIAYETLQNLPALLHANLPLTAIWKNEYIERIDLFWDESLALEGRANFYDRAGALKDVVQNHMVMTLAFLGMEPGFDPIPARRLAFLRAIQPIPTDNMATATRRARYTAGVLDGHPVPNYVDEEGVDPTRNTETYAEVTFNVDNDRWRGVPMRLRHGKAIGKPHIGAQITFRPVGNTPPATMWIGIDHDTTVSLQVTGRDPFEEPHAPTMALTSTGVAGKQTPYAHVMQDILNGTSDLSVSAAEAEEGWRIFEPIVEAWAVGLVPLEEYPAGSEGPTR